MRPLREFGPFQVLFAAESEADLLAQGRTVPYAEYLTQRRRLADGLECGVVWGNSAMLMDPALPFGGIKDSGLGVASGREAIETMTRLKRVSVRFQPDAPIPSWSDL